jgi:hypothetical protein
MLKRVIHLGVTSLFLLPALSCTTGGDDDGLTFGSFSSGQPTVTASADGQEEETESSGNGDGDGDPAGDGDGDGDTGDGDGDPTSDTDTGCTPGEFNCACDNGTCGPGLECNGGLCTLPSGDGDGDGDPTTTTGGGADPWDPNMCVMPSIPVSITGITGDLCSAPCVADLDCPAGPVGSDPACLLVLDGMVDPDHCVLICVPGNNNTCFPGSTCKDVPMQPGVGVCTYP